MEMGLRWKWNERELKWKWNVNGNANGNGNWNEMEMVHLLQFSMFCRFHMFGREKCKERDHLKDSNFRQYSSPPLYFSTLLLKKKRLSISKHFL